MISSNFGYGEQSKIASAYASMYAPKQMSESCCKKGGCKKSSQKCESSGLVSKHNPPKKTGSKLGSRKMLPFDKRDSKPSAKKFTPKTKVAESFTKGYCIVDGDSTLCTNDVGESYFNRNGICDNTRIYESKVSAMKDISKVKARRNPNSKYKVRCCECVGESFQFTDYQTEQVNEGLWDGIKSIGSAALNAGKAVGNVAGGALKGVGNLAQGNFAQAGADAWNGLKDAGGNIVDAGKDTLNTVGEVGSTVGDVAGAAGGVLKAGGNALQGDFAQAGEELKGAGSSALGAVADGAREADVGGGISNVAGAALNAAKEGAKAVGNTVASAGNVAGGVLKGVGNLAQGNLADAGNAVVDGAKGAVQNLKDAGQNVVNAATNDNAEKQAKAAAANAPLTQDQKTAVANGAAGPISDAEAKKINAANPQVQKENLQNSVNNTINQFMPDSVKQAMRDVGQKTAPQNGAPANGTPAPQQKPQAQQPQQNGQQAGGNKDQQKQQLQQQIAALQKQLAALG